jgi:hypothetical protein
MRNNRINVAAASLILISAAGAAWADDAPAAPAKPVLPSIADLLTGSGITATGEVSATFDHQGFSGSNASYPQQDSYSTFTLQQAALTVAYQPMTGFGALVTLLAGQNIYYPNYTATEAYSGAKIATSSTQVQLAQAYAQWIGGPLTVIAGKYLTIVGAEGLLASGNTNVTRSLLYSYEPVTHTGVRLTYAADSTLNLILGVNNGFVISDELSARTDKTLEAGAAWTPNKMFSWSLGGYYGRDSNALGIPASQYIIDTVATWTATSALTVIVSGDVGSTNDAWGLNTTTATWYGGAVYVNYAINDTWRVSARGEYYDDKDGYLTLYNQNFSALGYNESTATIKSAVGQNLYEGTVTFGYDPTKNIELRLEGRYDNYQGTSTFKVPSTNVYQGWLEANYHF